MTVAIIMPIGLAADGWRARAFRFIVDHYQQNHPAWQIHVGHGGDPWSKGDALAVANQTVDPRTDMLVVADADSYVDPQVLRDTVAAAADDGWAMPHATVHRLNQQATENVYAGHPARLDQLDRPAYRGVKGGGIVAVRRDAWVTVDGIDPRFEGWGGEDIAFSYALNALVGGGARLGGELVHLWHPHPAPDLRGSPPSETLLARYRSVRADPVGMRRLIDERKVCR